MVRLIALVMHRLRASRTKIRQPGYIQKGEASRLRLLSFASYKDVRQPTYKSVYSKGGIVGLIGTASTVGPLRFKAAWHSRATSSNVSAFTPVAP